MLARLGAASQRLDHILDWLLPYVHAFRVALKKVTVNLPDDLLAEARRVTGAGITETITDGLREIAKRRKREVLRSLRGKVRFDLDLDTTRS